MAGQSIDNALTTWTLWARLGEGQINIDYSYCGFEPGSTMALLVVGVDNLTKAAPRLDELAAEHE